MPLSRGCGTGSGRGLKFRGATGQVIFLKKPLSQKSGYAPDWCPMSLIFPSVRPVSLLKWSHQQRQSLSELSRVSIFYTKNRTAHKTMPCIFCTSQWKPSVIQLHQIFAYPAAKLTATVSSLTIIWNVGRFKYLMKSSDRVTFLLPERYILASV